MQKIFYLFFLYCLISCDLCVLHIQYIHTQFVGLTHMIVPCWLQLDPSIYESLQKEKVEVGDVIYIESNSGAVKVRLLDFCTSSSVRHMICVKKLNDFLVSSFQFFQFLQEKMLGVRAITRLCQSMSLIIMSLVLLVPTVLV